VFASRGWMRFALLCNFLGAILLFLSFQATSSNIRIITTADGRTALCVEKRGLIVAHPRDSLIAMQINVDCPEWEHARPAAVVNLELPWLADLGFILSILGFVLQFFAFPGPKSIAEMREELRIAKRLKK
jgi:hypothetical protein